MHESVQGAWDMLRRRETENLLYAYENYPFVPSFANVGPQALYVYEILKKALTIGTEEENGMLARWLEARRRWHHSKIVQEEKFGEEMVERLKTVGMPAPPPPGVCEKSEYFEEMWGELSTMVVSFDENGKPVCSVDLAKYGLSMPIIEPFPDSYRVGEKPTFTVVFPHETVGCGELGTLPQATNAISDIETEAELPTDTVQEDTPLPEQPQTSPKSNYLLWLGIGVLAVLLIGFLAWWKQGQKNL